MNIRRLAASLAFGGIVSAASLTAAPANDQCAGAIVISTAIHTNAQSTATATSTGDPAPTCQQDSGNGVWYQYTPPSAGVLDVDTLGSDFDTVLTAFTGSCGGLIEVDCNDDDLTSGTGATTSRLSMSVNGGVTYKFLASGTYNETGNLQFNLAFTPGGPPLITRQPVNQNVAVASNATFSVAAVSRTPMTFAWKRGDSSIPGANGTSYTVTNAQLSDSGSQFSCVVANNFGPTPSAKAILFVEQPVLLYAFDFETGLQGFTIDNTYNEGKGLWHWSGGRANDPGHSPSHSLYYGTNETATGGGNYNTGGANAGVVVSPPLKLSGAALLTFSYFMDVEPLGTGSFQSDLTYVEASTNAGASYTAIDQKGLTLVNYTGGFWATNSADLSPFPGNNVLLRFRFDTVDSFANDSEGWYLDDIRIVGLPAPPPIFDSVWQTNNLIEFSWNVATNVGCQLQFKTNLSQPKWINIGLPLTNAAMPVSETIGPDPQRFYRLELVQ